MVTDPASRPCHDGAMRRTLLLATALAWALTGCSGSGSVPTQAPSRTSAAAADAAATAPGTDLAFGEPATLAWEPTVRESGTLDLTVDAVAEKRQSVFDGWVRDDVMAASRPYFVTVSLTNAGDSDLGGNDVPLYLRDDNGTLGAPWTLGGDFTACQSGPLPTPFGPGDEAEMCLVYLVPDGARIDDMVFEPVEGYDPISWTGEAKAPAQATKKTPSQATKKTEKKPARKKRRNG